MSEKNNKNKISLDAISKLDDKIVESVSNERVRLLLLLKKKNIGKSGIVHPSAHAQIVKKVLDFAEENGLYPFGIVNAPVRKGKNIEYVLHIKAKREGALSTVQLVNTVQRFLQELK